jgi:hypothetical protein
VGDPFTVPELKDAFTLSTPLYWVDNTDPSDNNSPTPSEIMTEVTKEFSSSQLSLVHQASSTQDLGAKCQLNFNSKSPCFAGVIFKSIPPVGNVSKRVEFTLVGEAEFDDTVNVKTHNTEVEKRTLPLQYAIEKVSFPTLIYIRC